MDGFLGLLQQAMPQIAAARAAQGIAPGPLQMAMGMGGAPVAANPAQPLPIVQPPSAAPGFGVGVGAPGAAPDFNAILGQNMQLQMAQHAAQRQAMLQRMQQHFQGMGQPQAMPGGMQRPQGFGAGGATQPAHTAALPMNQALQGYGNAQMQPGMGQIQGVPTTPNINPTRTPGGPAGY